ncbi:heparan sulfate glucosamine 3-O-sulfotransferase 1-like [Saccoglossus kowalevskii]|uniref:Heparan sulfate glucosamine 3-O-sulfotransferase 5-like n=1 Tax=Saccoglossus kowalevskii TaxID=10224 RepID=A0ABM0GJ92_SACKO|nr:PREDICTED: heparan sulfate glucosamine 3-O-sulfotransferase 5-like [Saccoglossus kowalevskii]
MDRPQASLATVILQNASLIKEKVEDSLHRAFSRRGFYKWALGYLTLFTCLALVVSMAKSPRGDRATTRSLLAEKSSLTNLLNDSEYVHGVVSDDYTTWDASFDAKRYMVERWKTSCYYPTHPIYRLNKLLKVDEMKRRGCVRRLPEVVIAGVRKCGTGTLLRFLNFHPHLVGPKDETHYFDSLTEHGVQWYREQMPFSSRLQMTIEKTPTYYFRPFDAPKRIRQTLSSNVRILVILCDPVRRIVSDYVEFINKTDKAEQDYMQRKTLAESIESTVFEQARPDNVNTHNEMVDVGIYVKYLFRWLEQFPRSQIHFIDGDNFRNNPAEELQKVEKFLGVRPFFREEHFRKDSVKGQYCMAFPQMTCMPSSKGREHPELKEWAKKRLCEFYSPFDRALATLVKQNFTWIGKNC